jgi:hypothetical protein
MRRGFQGGYAQVGRFKGHGARNLPNQFSKL